MSPDSCPVALGVLVTAAVWLALFAEHFLGFGRGPERAWLAAGLLGTLSLVASSLPAASRGRLLSGVLLLVLGGVLQATVPNIAHAYDDGPLSLKSIFHYAAVSIPLVAGIVVLAWRRSGSWLRWLTLALAVLAIGGVVVLVVIDQRQGALVLSATPYEPRVPLWLPGVLAAVAVAAWQLKARRPSSIVAHLTHFAAGVAFFSVSIAVLLERLFAGSGYLEYQLGKPEFRPMLGFPAVWVLLGLAAVSLAGFAALGRRRGVRHGQGVAWGFHGVSVALTAAFFVYAMYAPKDPVLLYQVVSLNRSTGDVNWLSRGVTGPRGPMHSDNAPATPTPVSDGGRIYAWFGTPGLVCVDASGKQLWVDRDLPFRSRHGVATSPILCDGKVVILSDSDAGCYLAAVDCATGKRVWRTERNKRVHRYAGNCRTPTVMRVASRKTIVVWGYTDISGYDPATGREQWSHEVGDLGTGCNPVASLVSDDKRLYLVGLERMVALDIDKLPGPDTPIAWEIVKDTGAQCASPLLDNGLLFVVADNGTAYCIDPEAGEVLWEKRLRGVHYASPVAAGGRIYFCSTAGRTTVVQSSREYGEIGVSELGEVVHASFAPVGRQLFVRTAEGLYCLVEGADGGRRPPRDRTRPGHGPEQERGGKGGPSEPVPPNWLRFRGPLGGGVSTFDNIPVDWDGSSGKGIMWRTRIPLPGNSSPVVWEDRIFCTGADRSAQQVYCLDAKTGRLLWSKDAPPSAPMPEVSEMTGFAAPTPVTDGQRVCAIFANGVVVCFDRDGKQRWSRDLGVPDNMYGHASSPVISDKLLIIQYDQGAEDDNQSRLLALDTTSGDVAWQAPRATAASWATPLVVSTRERDELITCAQPWVIAYDPAKGTELWRAGCIGGDVVPSPIYAGGLIFTVSDRSSLAAIRPGGSGDVTDSHVAWTVQDALPDICSPVSDGKLVFILASYGLLTCLQADDGAVVWQQQLDATFRASPSLVGDKLYLLAEDGQALILAAERRFRGLGRCPLGEPVSASPAFAPGRLYIRGEKSLYCIGG